MLDDAVLVDLVVVEERAPRGLAHAHRLGRVHAGLGPEAGRQHVGVVHDLLDELDRGLDLHQAGVVVPEPRVLRPPAALAILFQLVVGFGHAHSRAQVEPGQGADAVDARGEAQGDVIGRLQVAVGLDGLADEFAVVLDRQGIVDDVAFRVLDAEAAVVVLPGAVGSHQPHVEGGEVAERLGLLAELVVDRLVQGDRRGGGGLCLGEPRADSFTAFLGEGLAHAAGDRPRRMDLPAAQQFDDLLAELPQADARAGQVGVGGDHAEDVPRGRVAVHAEEQVGGAEVEEAQRVRLDDLPQVHQATELLGRLGDLHREDDVTGLRRGHQVAHGADPTDPRRDAGHLPEGPTLAELLEATELSHVEPRVRHVPLVVEVDRDLGMALDPRDRIDHDPLTRHDRLSLLPATRPGRHRTGTMCRLALDFIRT